MDSKMLRDLELAMVLLSHIEFVHQSNRDEAEPPNLSTLLISEIAPLICSQVATLEFNLHRDVYLIDMVGNTICADLLDYARRDATKCRPEGTGRRASHPLFSGGLS